MSLGFGLLSAQLNPGESDWARVYDETVRLAVAAEQMGLGSIWTTEHHFVDDGYMPSLAVVSAAIAAATTTIEIGTGVILAPLHHPLRLAEDAATVSLLSGGRFTLGLGLGWSVTEFDGLGADMRRRGETMEEILSILPKAWSGEVFHHQGSIYDLPELAVRPTPSKPIDVLVGGGAEAAIRRAARSASGLFANVPADELIQQLRWIDDECERIGRDPAELRIVHYSVMLPASSEDEAFERYQDHLWQMTWKYGDMEDSTTRPGPPPAAPPFDPSKRDRLFGRATVAGSGDRIVSYLHDIRERAGRPIEFAARSYFPTLPYDDQLAVMQQLAEEVSPHV